MKAVLVKEILLTYQCLRQQVSRWGQKRQADSTCLAV
jgi:hypothetical protein